MTAFDQVLALIDHLSPTEKIRLLERVTSSLEKDLPATEKKPRKSLYGLWADFNVNISEADIDAARREMWGNFPREDF